MKRLAALLLALAVATPAWGATYYADPDGDDGNDGLSAGAPKTITWYLNNATAGDIVYLADGTYPSSQTNESSLFSHLHGGTAESRVTYIGDIDEPGNVRFDAGWLLKYNVYGPLHGNSYVTVKGISVNGTMEIQGDLGDTPQQAIADSIVYCIADSGFAVARFDDCVIAFNTFGSNGATNVFHLGGGAQGNSHSLNNKIHYNSIYTGISGAQGGNAVTFTRLDSCQVTSNRFYQRHHYTADAGVHGNTWFGCQNNLFIDNHWNFRTDASSVRYALNMRDSTRFNLLLRDTIRVDTLSTSLGKIDFTTSGTYGKSGYNTFSHCLFVSNSLIGYQNTGDGDLHEFNQYVMGGASAGPFYFPSADAVMDSVTFRHNTFYTDAARLWTMDTDTTSYALTNNRIVSNIFYSNSSSAGTLMLYKWSVAGGERDSNLYFKAANDSAAKFDYAYNSKDETSHWATPAFELARWQTPRLTPAAASLAVSSDLWADGYVGAFGEGGEEGGGLEEPEDDIAPVVVIAVPSGEGWECKDLMHILWTATDGVGVVRLDVEYGVGETPTAWYGVAGNLSPIVNCYSWQVPDIAIVTIRVIATDAANNAGTGTATFTTTCPPTGGMVDEE